MDSKDVISLCLSQSPPPSNTPAAHRIQRVEPQSSYHANAKFCTIVSEKLDEGDIRGAVRIACSSDVVAPYDADSFYKLQMKHPLIRLTAEPFQLVTLLLCMLRRKMSVLLSAVLVPEQQVERPVFVLST